MPTTERISREIATVKEKYPGAYELEDSAGNVDLIIPELPIPDGFTSKSARILVHIPALYPAQKLDLFWLAPTLARTDGVPLKNIMQPVILKANESWKQISWHNNIVHTDSQASVLGFVRGILKWFEEQR